MANIGESLTTRLARERLQAITFFIPVLDSVKQKLQARQQAKIEFTEGAEELFKPVTTVTEAVKTAIVGKPDPKDPDKQQPSLLQAIEGLKPQQKEEGAAGPSDEEAEQQTSADKPVRENIPLIAKFNEGAIKQIKSIPEKDFPRIIYTGLYDKKRFLKQEYAKTTDEVFVKWMYRVYYDKIQAKHNDPLYEGLVKELNRIDKAQQQQLPPPPPYSPPQKRKQRQKQQQLVIQEPIATDPDLSPTSLKF